jgi:nicotinate-nucleotide pyrophosphorylase (carboxylating)
LTEDVGSGDVTTLATVPDSAVASANMVARESMVVCGLDIAINAFTSVSPNLKFEKNQSDGSRAEKGATLLHISGSARALLAGERVCGCWRNTPWLAAADKIIASVCSTWF